jgi:hypothetical protein
VNGNAVGSGAPNSSNQFSVALPKLGAGQVNVSASYAGDANNGSSADSTNITIQKAPLTLTATSFTITKGDAIPTLTYSMTGFVNGDTTSALSGSPTLSSAATSSSAAGTYPVTITTGTISSANYSFVLINGAIIINPPPSPDFTLTSTPSSLTVTRPYVGIVTLSLTPLYGYTGGVTLACSSVPTNMSCGFTGPFVGNGPGSPSWTQVRLATKTSTTASLRGSHLSGDTLFAFEFPLGLLSMIAMKRRKLRPRALLMAIAAMAFAGMLSGCGSSPSALTAPGVYNVVVTATDSASNLSHSTTITLTVQ